MNIYIYQSTFGFSCMKTKNTIPLEVGADLRSNFLYKDKDNTGDNISNQNAYYGELTGIYWIWKNHSYKKSDIIGFCHYNKTLQINTNNIKDYLLNNNSGWIVAEEKKMPPHSDITEWKALNDIIKDKFPGYYKSFNEIYNADGSSIGCNTANVFITTWSQFEKYCSFLFSVCSNLRDKIGNNEKDRFEKRYCAFFGERLLSVYLKANNLPYKEVPIKYNKYYVLKLGNIAHRLHLNKNSKTYKKIKTVLLRNSSSSSYRR